MAIFEWNESLSVGVAAMDNQHKRLYAVMNELFLAMSQGKGQDVLEKVTDELVNYTRTHFTAEERLLTTHGYPGLAAQKTSLEEFTHRVTQTAAPLRQGRAVMTVSVSSFLRDWLTKHIQGSDKQYGPFLNGKGVF